MVLPKKVLVVDEDDTALFLAQIALKRIAAEAQVQMAKNGQQALQMVRTDCQQDLCPQLIFLSIQRQLSDSLAFLEALQTAPDLNQLPVRIVLVGTSPYYLQLAQKEGLPVLDYIEKPLTPEKLIKFLG